MSNSAPILPDNENVYVPLHCHTEHSVLDGLSKPSELAHRAAELGFPACAITDHGAMSGCVEFYQACQKEGIKPILGMEAYMTPYGHSLTERVPYDVKELRNALGKGHQRNNYHCILLAKDYDNGYRNLCALHTAAYAQGYYYKPRIDFELLKEHHEGIIVQNACVLGEVNHHLLHEDFDMAREHALRLQEIFGDDYYFEIMNHNLDIELAIMPRIRELARELGIKVVATNDSHFTYGPNYGLNGDGSGNPELDKRRRMDYKLQRTMMLLGFHKSWGDDDVSGSFFDEDSIMTSRQQKLKDDDGGDSSDPIFEMEPSLYVKSYDEMLDALRPGGGDNGIAEEELANTLEVAAKCNCELPIIDPSDMSQYHTPLYTIERDIQYDAYQSSEFKLRQETIDKVIAAMNESGKVGSTLEDVLNEHERASLHFLMWMCEKGIDERIRPKIEAKGEPLPIEFYMKNPPEGFEVVHKHNSPDESFIKGKLSEGLSPQDIIQEYFDRLDYEVSVVCRKGFLDYFAIVQQYCNYARFNDSPPGPGRGCLTPDTLILLANGEVKSISNVNAGDVVFDEFGDKAIVERRYEYDVEEELRDLTIFSGGHLKLTSDHKVLVTRAQRSVHYDEENKSGKYVQYVDETPSGKREWVRAEDVHKGDWVFLPKPQREVHHAKTYDLSDFIPDEIRDRCHVYDDRIERLVYPRAKVELSARLVARISGISRNAIRDFLRRSDKTTSRTIQRLNEALSEYGLTAEQWRDQWTPWKYVEVIPRYVKLDKDFARFMGYFIADGNAHKNCCHLYFHEQDQEYIETYSKIVKKVFDKDLELYRPFEDKQLVAGKFSSPVILSLITSLVPGKTPEKFIPEDLMHLDDESTKCLLLGLVDGDGSAKDPGRVSFDSICRRSVYQFRYLSMSLGSLGSVSQRNYKNKNWQTSYKVRLTTGPLVEELFGIPDKTSSTGHMCVDLGDCFAMRVKSNTSFSYIGKVYDLQVHTKNEPSYATTSGIVHNSGAGALLNYLLGITSVDPLPNKLIFERFLNPDRVGYPDVDVDFDKSFRDGLGKYASESELGGGLKGYLREEYGPDNAAGVSTFIYAWGKAALRAAARVLFSPPESVQWADELCNLIDDHPKLDLNSELQEGVNPAFVAKVNSAIHYKQILDLALMLQGRITGTSIHASAFILSPHAITDKMPLTVPKAERERVQKTGEKTVDYLISYDGTITQEALGYVKLDLLCIKDLEVLTRTMETVERVYGCKIDIENIPMDDEAVFQMLYDHNVAGIFQLDGSAGMAQVMDDVKPQSIEEMNAVIALFRPGPMDYIPNYVNGKWHPESVRYLDPRLEPILKDTYGVCVAEGSLISTDNGLIPIEQIRPGMNIQTDENEYHRCEAVIDNGIKECIRVKTTCGGGLYCTPEHKLLTQQGWVEAQYLTTFDLIKWCDPFQEQSGGSFEWVQVSSVIPSEQQHVFDLTIEEKHLYIANGYVVHNCAYQEEAMQITQVIAGFSGGQADNYRKQAAKKHMDQLVLIKDDFISGALANDTDPEVADELWEQLVKFGSYAFNRSHSAAYAYIAYRGGFLKAHFPEAFLAAMCTIKPQMKKTDKVPSYLDEARQMGVTIKPPHVNYSMEDFDVPEKGVLAFGLGGIKRVGKGAAPIIAEREAHGPFRDFSDFCLRVPKEVGKAPLEALIKAGALDGLGWSRMAMEESIEQIVDFRKRYFAEKEKKALFADDLFGSMGTFEVPAAGAPVPASLQSSVAAFGFAAEDDPAASDPLEDDELVLLPPFETEYTEFELMRKEKETFGMYFDKDPRDFSRVSRYMAEKKLAEDFRAARKAGDYEHPAFINVKKVASMADKANVEFIANVEDIRQIITKSSGKPMAFIRVWDNGEGEESRFGFAPTRSSVKLTCFPKTWANMTRPLVDDVVHVVGKINVDPEGRFETSVIVDELEVLPSDAEWTGPSAPLEKTMEFAEAQKEMLERDDELGDPSAKRYMIPALTFKTAEDLDGFLNDPETDRYRGDGRVQVSVVGDDDGSRTGVVSLKQTRGMVAYAIREHGALDPKKIRLPKAQRALERRKMMGKA